MALAMVGVWRIGNPGVDVHENDPDSMLKATHLTKLSTSMRMSSAPHTRAGAMDGRVGREPR
jgi:hypothetical protein